MRSVLQLGGGWTPLKAKLSSCGEDTGPSIYYLSTLAPSLPGPVRVLFGGEQMDEEAEDVGLGGGMGWVEGGGWGAVEFGGTET